MIASAVPRLDHAAEHSAPTRRNSKRLTNERETHPLLAVQSLCKSWRHCSQKYSSGLDSSVMMPTQPPCCQTLQTSHCTNKPAVSSVTSAEKNGSSPNACLNPCLESSSNGGGPWYSSLPQTQRTASSSSWASPSPSAMSTASALLPALSLSSACPRVRRRVPKGSSAVMVSSGGSDDSESVELDFCGDAALLKYLELRSGRPETLEAVEEICDCD